MSGNYVLLHARRPGARRPGARWGRAACPPLGTEGALLFIIRVIERHVGHLPIRGPSRGARSVPELTLVTTGQYTVKKKGWLKHLIPQAAESDEAVSVGEIASEVELTARPEHDRDADDPEDEAADEAEEGEGEEQSE